MRTFSQKPDPFHHLSKAVRIKDQVHTGGEIISIYMFSIIKFAHFLRRVDKNQPESEPEIFTKTAALIRLWGLSTRKFT